MNTKRKFIITLYAFLMFLLCIVLVPKNIVHQNDSNIGYGQIYEPIWVTEQELSFMVAEIDFTKLLLEIVGVTALFVPLYLFTEERKS